MSHQKLTKLNLKRFQDPAESNRLNVWANRVVASVDELEERATTIEGDITTIEGDITAIEDEALAGDVTGARTANTVVKIQNIPVSTTDPTTDQVLAYDGAEWVPTTLNSGEFSERLWAWNGTDTSQFGSGVAFEGDGAAPLGSVALSVVAIRGRNGLRLSGTSLAGGYIFPISNLTLPDRYKIRLRVIEHNITLTHPSLIVGLTYKNASGVINGLMAERTPNTTIHCTRAVVTDITAAGQMAFIGTSATWDSVQMNQGGALIEYIVDRQVGNNPNTWTIYGTENGGTTPVGGGSGASTQSAFPTTTAWNSNAFDLVGFGMLEEVAQSTKRFTIQDMEIWSLP